MRLKKLDLEPREGWKKIERVLHYQSLLYIPAIIQTELISQYHNDFSAGYFKIRKTRELITRKYYWQILQHDVEIYVKKCDVYLTSKTMRHKPYENLLILPTQINC